VLLFHQITAASAHAARGALLLLFPCVAAAAQSSGASCGLAGGGFIKVHDYDVVFSATADADSSTLHGLIIVRAPADFLSRPAPTAPPPLWGANRMLGPSGGGSVGPLWIVHEEATNTVWIDSLSVPLDSTNNVLLVEVDAHGAVAVAGQARIASVPVPPGACDSGGGLRYQQVSDALWVRFLETPRVRAFVSR